MRLLQRNLRPVWFSLYLRKEKIFDGDGYNTSERTLIYTPPRRKFFSISPARGYTQTEIFGNLESYDLILITDDMNCPIDEDSVLFVELTPEAGEFKRYNYVVRRVAKSLNFIAYAVSKVDATAKIDLSINYAVDAESCYAVDEDRRYAVANDS